MCHPCLLGDIADTGRVVPVPREDPHGGGEDLAALLLGRGEAGTAGSFCCD